MSNWALTLWGADGKTCGGCFAQTPRGALEKVREIEAHDRRAVRIEVSGPRQYRETYVRGVGGAFVVSAVRQAVAS